MLPVNFQVHNWRYKSLEKSSDMRPFPSGMERVILSEYKPKRSSHDSQLCSPCSCCRITAQFHLYMYILLQLVLFAYPFVSSATFVHTLAKWSEYAASAHRGSWHKWGWRPFKLKVAQSLEDLRLKTKRGKDGFYCCRLLLEASLACLWQTSCNFVVL